MNIDTFLKIYQTMSQVIAQMEQKGIIKKTPPAIILKSRLFYYPI